MGKQIDQAVNQQLKENSIGLEASPGFKKYKLDQSSILRGTS